MKYHLTKSSTPYREGIDRGYQGATRQMGAKIATLTQPQMRLLKAIKRIERGDERKAAKAAYWEVVKAIYNVPVRCKVKVGLESGTLMYAD